MAENAKIMGKATGVHTVASNAGRVPVAARSCDLNVPPASESILGRCEFYYRPLHDEYVAKSGLASWKILKSWATIWDPMDDTEVLQKLLRYRDKLIVGDSTDGLWSRHSNFMMRHIGCGHKPPDYYISYGYYYCSTYGAHLHPRLSALGQAWLVSARKNLQRNLEKGLEMNMLGDQINVPCRRFPNKSVSMIVSKNKLEIDSKTFKKFAFNTHVPAYLDGGLADLPESDLLKIGGQPNIEEWTDKDTWSQAYDSGLVVGAEKIKAYARSASGVVTDVVEATLMKLTSWLK